MTKHKSKRAKHVTYIVFGYTPEDARRRLLGIEEKKTPKI